MRLAQQLTDRDQRVNDLVVPIGKRLRYRLKGAAEINDCAPRVLSYAEHRNKQRVDSYRQRRGW